MSTAETWGKRAAVRCVIGGLLGLLLTHCVTDPQSDLDGLPQETTVAPRQVLDEAVTLGSAGAAAPSVPQQDGQAIDHSSTPAGRAAPPPSAAPASTKAEAPPVDPTISQPPAAANVTTAPTEAWPADCKERFVFRAHGQSVSGDTSKYSIEPGAERQVLFYFRSPWQVNALQLLQDRERIDNPRVVHHWMLYLIENDTVHSDGEVLEDISQQSLTALLTQQSLLGGIPGGGNMTLPEGVGLHLPSDPNAVYALSLHYMNITDTTQTDASGIEVCVTDQKRAADATTHWLGKLSFELPARAQTDIRSTCRPTAMEEPAHIIATAPHMHGYGRHANLTIKRASGAELPLLDAAYDFAEPRVYDVLDTHPPEALQLNPGDQIDVTCSFENTSDSVVHYGESVHDEMCFMNVLAWPVGSLANHAQFARAPGLSEDQSCLEP